MNPLKPKISIIVPHYNSERYLRKSVGSILTQSFDNLDLYLVDDNSKSDEWLGEIKMFRNDSRLKILKSNVRAGPYRLKNRILESITTPLIGFQDSDDISHVDRLSSQIDYLTAHDCDIVGTGFYMVDENGNENGHRHLGTDCNNRHKEGEEFLCLHPTTIMKTSFLKKLGGFDGTTMFAADTDFHVRSTYIGKIRNIEKVLYYYRTRKNSLTQSKFTGFNSQARNEYVKKMNVRFSSIKLDNLTTGNRLFRAMPNDLNFELSEIKF